MSSSNTIRKQLIDLMKQRILFFDGAMGTMIQSKFLQEKHYRNAQVASIKQELKGNHDLLSLTHPELIKEIHRNFLKAGANIIETNTFCSNSISQADYQCQHLIPQLNKAAVALAKEVAREQSAKTPSNPRFVAGAIGPTNKMTSMSPDVSRPGFRNMTFDELVCCYREQVAALRDAQVDLFLVETIFDTLNAKAAVHAIYLEMRNAEIDIPILVSGTITDASGRTLSGQTPEAFFISMDHCDPLAVGFNCSLGPKDLFTAYNSLHQISHRHTLLYPNAGLPNEFGEYDLEADEMVLCLGEFAEKNMLNIVGGCCGTTYEHIAAIVKVIGKEKPRVPKPRDHIPRYSGLEELALKKGSLFVNVGERTNVSGSKKFCNLIKKGEMDQALDIARNQVENGAQIIDVNMDEGLIDSLEVMRQFLFILATEPSVARVPVMLDSSKWEVLEAGLKCLQGKSILNSISLKEGEKDFIEKATLAKTYGAAVVVMAFDETGQADTFERKRDICQRAYTILTQEVGMRPEDIIFDPNIFAVATGIAEHDRFALDFLESISFIKEKLPHALVSGGVSNLSFSYRGNEFIRKAMHSIFLFHAIKRGMDMGIVNAGMITIYDDIDKDLRTLIEDLYFRPTEDIKEKLTTEAVKYLKMKSEGTDTTSLAWRELPLQERITYSLVNGIDTYIVDDMRQAREEEKDKYPRTINIIEGPLMDGMNKVGELFGSGQMFLPQVVKSARVMKKGVNYLIPYIEEEKKNQKHEEKEDKDAPKGKVVLATVKGDVHDIGKNIVSVVLACNGHEIHDLGVMVPAETILQKAKEVDANIIGLSGLITPSLDEMVTVAQMMQGQGMKVPLLIGGATTSEMHTAVKINPSYDPGVVYVQDASKAVGVVAGLLKPDNRTYLNETKEKYSKLMEEFNSGRQKQKRVTLEEARENAFKLDLKEDAIRPKKLGLQQLEVDSLTSLIPFFDWTPFFWGWDLKGTYPEILKHKKYGDQVKKLYADAMSTLDELKDKKIFELKAVFRLMVAESVGDSVRVVPETNSQEVVTLNFLRQQTLKTGDKANYSLADFIRPQGSGPDYMGVFVVTAGSKVDELAKIYQEKDQDDYKAIMVKLLADRLAEALAEYLHYRVRTDFWGYSKDEKVDSKQFNREKYNGIRPAPGYPACPDHHEKQAIFQLLNQDKDQYKIVELTENLSMAPAASVCGYYFGGHGARYFNVGKVQNDQLLDYAERKNMPLADVKKWLASNTF